MFQLSRSEEIKQPKNWLKTFSASNMNKKLCSLPPQNSSTSLRNRENQPRYDRNVQALTWTAWVIKTFFPEVSGEEISQLENRLKKKKKVHS